MTDEERAAEQPDLRQPVNLRVPRRPRLVPFKSIDDMRLENHRGGARRYGDKSWETSRGVPFFRKGGSVKKYEEGGEVDREVRRPAFAKEMLPTRPTSQQRRMARRAPPPAPPRPSDTDVMKGIVKDMTREERVRKAEMPSEIYRKGGGVKMAGGGTCRGMGAATKGGKYTIK